MKKIIFITILSFLCTCTVNKISSEQIKNNNMFETFDFDKYYSSNRDSLKLKDGTIVYQYVSMTYEYNPKGEINLVEENLIPPKPSFSKMIKEYYPTGFIKEKGEYFGVKYTEVKIGKWYYFDEKGNLTKEVDEDKKFGKFDYKALLTFLDKKGDINVKTGKNRENIEAFYHYSNSSELKLWNVFILQEVIDLGDAIERKGNRYYLDGNTGTEIKGEELLKYKPILPKFDIMFPELKEQSTVMPQKEIGKPISKVGNITEGSNIHQVYKGKAYTKAEWQEYVSTLSWLERQLLS